MNTKLAIRFIETLEPHSRRLVEKCEKDKKYMTRWYGAYLQAKMVLRAYDTHDSAIGGGG